MQLKRHKEVARLAATSAEEHAAEVGRTRTLSCAAHGTGTTPTMLAVSSRSAIFTAVKPFTVTW